MEQQLFQLANGERRNHDSTSDLLLDATLGELARQHSRAMRDQRFFGHVGPQGADLQRRLEAGGVVFDRAAENLAKVTHSVDPATFAHGLLMASAEHQANILNPEFRRVGVGVAQAGDTFWITQIFVAP